MQRLCHGRGYTHCKIHLSARTPMTMLMGRLAGVALELALAALLLLFLPPYYVYRFTASFLGSVFPDNVSGKVVLITGASSGIGEHLAYEYAKRGANLALVARREASLREVTDNASALGSPSVLVLPADVSKPDDCLKFIDDTVAYFGRCKSELNGIYATVDKYCYMNFPENSRLTESIYDIYSCKCLMITGIFGESYQD
ncbi:hypothetical protein VPH35_037479 [Triticum aestivum]